MTDEKIDAWMFILFAETSAHQDIASFKHAQKQDFSDFWGELCYKLFYEKLKKYIPQWFASFEILIPATNDENSDFAPCYKFNVA